MSLSQEIRKKLCSFDNKYVNSVFNDNVVSLIRNAFRNFINFDTINFYQIKDYRVPICRNINTYLVSATVSMFQIWLHKQAMKMMCQTQQRTDCSPFECSVQFFVFIPDPTINKLFYTYICLFIMTQLENNKQWKYIHLRTYTILFFCKLMSIV